jgi:DNA-binding NtrC family response regulator
MTRKEPFKPVALVVDDDEVGRLICADLLFSNGFDVIEADDGEPALEFFKQHHPDGCDDEEDGRLCGMPCLAIPSRRSHRADPYGHGPQ